MECYGLVLLETFAYLLGAGHSPQLQSGLSSAILVITIRAYRRWRWLATLHPNCPGSTPGTLTARGSSPGSRTAQGSSPSSSKLVLSVGSSEACEGRCPGSFTHSGHLNIHGLSCNSMQYKWVELRCILLPLVVLISAVRLHLPKYLSN